MKRVLLLLAVLLFSAGTMMAQQDTGAEKAAKKAENPAQYPSELFTEKLPAMRQAIADGKMDAAKVIAHCEKTGKLTDEQKAAISAPITEEAAQ